MGCSPSKIDEGEKVASQKNSQIDRQLKADRKTDSRTVKILLLGGESGRILRDERKLTESYSWRVGKEYNNQTDADHKLKWLPRR